jgi:hypothetical protein
MILLTDIMTVVNKMLFDKFGYKTYGREITEGFDRPSFFVDFLLTASDTENQNYTSNKLTVKIVFFPAQSKVRGNSDLVNLTMYDNIRRLFGNSIQVGSRYLHPQNFRMDYAGQNQDVMQTSFDIDYFCDTDFTRDTEEKMTDISLNLKEA